MGKKRRKGPTPKRVTTTQKPDRSDSVAEALGRTLPSGPSPVRTPAAVARAPKDRQPPKRRPVRESPPQAPQLVLEDEVVAPHGCAGGIFADADPQGLAASYTFDTSGWAAPGPVAIAFAGTRLDGTGQPADRFERVERIPDLGPRSGRVTITARIQRLEPGRWRVIAGPVQTDPERPLPRKAIVASTQLALLAQGPGVRLLAWPALVGLGAVVAVLLQALLVQRAGLSAPTVVGLSVLGCVLGSPGGKLWYLVANRRPPSEFLKAGACIQGFLLVALLVVSLGSFLLDLSVGVILDATAPGIFFGMAIGRPGCFFTGCCAGCPTMSRWGLWSSDRRLGIRRVPVQLVEAAAALLIGLVSLLLVLAVEPPFAGAIFVGAIAAYTFCRQILFRLRSQSHTRVGRLVTQVLCASILAALVVAFVTG